MKIIYKYQLDKVYNQKVMIPQNGIILKVAVQRDQPCLWVLHEIDSLLNEEIDIFIVGTGERFDEENVEHIDTFLTENDTFVFHVFKTTATYIK
jgi:hypothetical protein